MARNASEMSPSRSEPQLTIKDTIGDSEPTNRDTTYLSGNASSLEVKAVPLAQAEEVSLHDAINSAPLVQLQRLLVEITDGDMIARKQASARLLRPVPGSSRKRKAFEKCMKCGSDYHIDDNGPEECVYHNGEKEIDDDSSAWWDFDENPDDFIDDPDFAHDVIWTCCEKKADSEGCVKDSHRARAEDVKKRGRIDVASLMN